MSVMFFDRLFQVPDVYAGASRDLLCGSSPLGHSTREARRLAWLSAATGVWAEQSACPCSLSSCPTCACCHLSDVSTAPHVHMTSKLHNDMSLAASRTWQCFPAPLVLFCRLSG